MILQFTVEKLVHPEQSGDWHDKPLRWIAQCVDRKFTQKFATKKNAELWVRLVRRHGDFNAASRAYCEAP